MAIHLMELKELTSHDVYELIYAHGYGAERPFAERQAPFWAEDNRYLSGDGDGRGMDALVPALCQVCPGFNWYGPNQVTLNQWRQVETLHLMACPEDKLFFWMVWRWLEEGNRGEDWFWIMGP